MEVCSSENKMEKLVYTFRWVIENPSHCWHRKECFLESPIFVVNALDKSKWRLCIYPRGKTNNPGFCSIYLRREKSDDGPERIQITYDFLYPSENASTVLSFKIKDHLFPVNHGYGVPGIFPQAVLFRSEKITFSCKMYNKDETSSKVEYSFATTLIGKESNSFTWEIQNFCDLTPIREEIIDIKSESTGLKRMSLKFLLVEGIGCGEYLCLEAVIADEKIRIQAIKLFIVDTTGKPIKCDLDERAFRTIDKRCLIPLRFSMRQLMKKKEQYLNEGTLKLLCELSYSTGIVLEDINSACSLEELKSFGGGFNEREQSKASVLNDLESLLKEKAMCDVKLRTKAEVLPCHKLILSAASPVFRSMFSHPMKEKDSKFVDIPDLEGCILHRMLLYLYSGTLDLSWETACALYGVADRYQIISLKDKCGFYIKANVSVENACEGLILADLHQDYGLKRTIQNYILNRGTSIINSKSWRRFMKTNIQLAAETMQLKWLIE